MAVKVTVVDEAEPLGEGDANSVVRTDGARVEMLARLVTPGVRGKGIDGLIQPNEHARSPQRFKRWLVAWMVP